MFARFECPRLFSVRITHETDAHLQILRFARLECLRLFPARVSHKQFMPFYVLNVHLDVFICILKIVLLAVLVLLIVLGYIDIYYKVLFIVFLTYIHSFEFRGLG